MPKNKYLDKIQIFEATETLQHQVLSKEILESIEFDYSQRTLPRSKSRFSEDKWLIINGDSDKLIPLNFLYSNKEEFSKEHAPIKLFLKVFSFHLLTTENKIKNDVYSAPQIKNIILSARAFIVDLFIENEILCQSFDEDGRLVEQPRPPSLLTPSAIQSLIDEICERYEVTGTSKKKLSDLSFYLGDQFEVPHYLKVAYNPFYYRVAYTLDPRKESDRSERGYEIIPDNDYFWIGKSAIDFIESYGDDIVCLHDVVVEAFKISPPNELKDKLIDVKHNKNKGAINDWRLVYIAEQLLEQNIKLPEFTDSNCVHWDIERVSLNGIEMTTKSLKEEGFTFLYITRLFKVLVGACFVLILIPTGMRASELMKVDISNLSKEPNEDGVFCYGNAVKKVRSQSTWFCLNDIPIPHETRKAMLLLEGLSAKVRSSTYSKVIVPHVSCYTIHLLTKSSIEIDDWNTVTKYNFSEPTMLFINQHINNFCNFIRSETLPTSHQFRTTLANFFLSKTKKAPMLLMQLFGHRSLAMTMKYLKKNKLVSREVKVRIQKKFLKKVKVVADAVLSETLAGSAGERLLESVKSRKDRFEGISEAEMIRELECWLLEKIESGEFLITHTPSNMCCRPINAKDKPQCHNTTCMLINPSLPAPEACIGAGCEWALYTFEQAESLSKNLIYYKNLLDSVDQNTVREQHFIDIASEFIETYDPILNRIRRLPAETIQRIGLTHE